jgi:competence protein ComEA
VGLRSGRGAEWIQGVDLGRWASGLGVAVVVLAVAAAVFMRRPPPIEEQLPMADGGSGAASSTTRPNDVGDTAEPDPAGSGAGEGQPQQLVVHVAGAVSAPGVVRLSAASRVVDAVTAAGGLRADADPDRVNLAAPLVDGQRVVVPVIGQPPPAEIPPSSPVGAVGGSTGAAGAAGAAAGPVDLNTATAEQLDTLPGVGPATAGAIIDHRGSSGPFDSVEDLLDVRGIGEAKLEALRDLVSVGSGR